MNIVKSRSIDQLSRDKLRKRIEGYYGSVSEFAKDVGISRNAMYDILNGKYYPRVKHYLAMCECLYIDPWLMQTFLPEING